MTQLNGLFKPETPAENPVFLAPMSGISDMPYRSLMKKMGADIVVSELISADGIHFGGEKTLSLMRFDEETERPFGLQIFGSDTDRMVEAAVRADQLGVDFVDINLGCPVRKVVKRGAGSALLRDPAELGKMLEAIARAIEVPLTIKIRTGWDDQSINATEVCHVAAESGVRMVAIHGRTRAQAYEGLANWDLIGEAAVKSPVPVIGNGDILTAPDALNKMRDYPVAGIMIGRGALKNPFIFQEIQALRRGGRLEEVSRNYPDLLKHQLEAYQQVYTGKRERMTLILMRKFIAWYSAGFPGGSKLRRRLFEISGVSEIFETAQEFFSRIHWEDRQDIPRFLMGGHG